MTTSIIPSSTQSTALSRSTTTKPKNIVQWKEKFSTLSKFKTVYSEINWQYALENPEAAFLNYSPTIYDVMLIFDRNNIFDWVATNVLSIWMLKPDNDPFIYQQAKSWARLWTPMNKSYTVGELTLFFARCKAGKYNLGYKLDLTRLGNIFSEQFLKERHVEIETYRNNYEEAERERLRKEDEKLAISYEEYKKAHPNFDLSGKIKLLIEGKQL